MLALLLTAAAVSSTAADISQIRARRTASNAAIVAHDADRAIVSMYPAARILGSGGGTVDGTAAMRAAFGRSFGDPNFVAYVRTPDRIEPNGDVAAETGHWRGIWRDHTISGRYLARWARRSGGWQIISEMYVPIGCRGTGCAR